MKKSKWNKSGTHDCKKGLKTADESWVKEEKNTNYQRPKLVSAIASSRESSEVSEWIV